MWTWLIAKMLVLSLNFYLNITWSSEVDDTQVLLFYSHHDNVCLTVYLRVLTMLVTQILTYTCIKVMTSSDTCQLLLIKIFSFFSSPSFARACCYYCLVPQAMIAFWNALNSLKYLTEFQLWKMCCRMKHYTFSIFFPLNYVETD